MKLLNEITKHRTKTEQQKLLKVYNLRGRNFIFFNAKRNPETSAAKSGRITCQLMHSN